MFEKGTKGIDHKLSYVQCTQLEQNLKIKTYITFFCIMHYVG